MTTGTMKMPRGLSVATALCVGVSAQAEMSAEELAKLASELRQDAWPMPLFKRLRGKLTDAELQAIVDALPPAAREYAALETHFVISQAHLANNERRLAYQHLNWLSRYSLPGSLFEVLATRDKFSEAYADPDMREAWKIESKKGSRSDIVRHLTAAAERGITSAQRAMGALPFTR